MSPNPGGHPATLQPSHPGNRSAERSGVYSRRPLELTERAREVAASLMDAPHVVPLDRLAAEEIGKLVDVIERIDEDLAERGIRGHGGHPRRMLEMRARFSSRLERWLREFGATPASRADWAAKMAAGGLAVEIARRRAENGAEGGTSG